MVNNTKQNYYFSLGSYPLEDCSGETGRRVKRPRVRCGRRSWNGYPFMRVLCLLHLLNVWKMDTANGDAACRYLSCGRCTNLQTTGTAWILAWLDISVGLRWDWYITWRFRQSRRITRCYVLTCWPGQKCQSRWCTRRKWHILMAVMRGNRVGGNWLMKWDEVKKIPLYSHRLPHRKRVTSELHDSYFRSMTITQAIPKVAEVTHPGR